MDSGLTEVKSTPYRDTPWGNPDFKAHSPADSEAEPPVSNLKMDMVAVRPRAIRYT
jgi:hypothetical protein